MPEIREQSWHVGRDGNVYDRGKGGRLVARVRDRAIAEQIARLPELLRKAGGGDVPGDGRTRVDLALKAGMRTDEVAELDAGQAEALRGLGPDPDA